MRKTRYNSDSSDRVVVVMLEGPSMLDIDSHEWTVISLVFIQFVDDDFWGTN